MSRGIITMAYGPEKYIDQAMTLRRSLRRHYPDLPVAIVTDADPASLDMHFDVVVSLRPDWGSGVDQKLRLPDYTPYDETLFIDSDCLVVRDLDFLWPLLSGQAVSVVTGMNLVEGEWLGADIARARAAAGAAGPLPVFNGGLVYLRRGQEASAVFADARRLMGGYSELGFADVKGRTWTASEEPVLGLAMARAGLRGVNDRGEGMRTLIGVRRPPRVNVRTGESSVSKNGTFIAHPAIVHFAHTGTRSLLYRRERLRLAGALGSARRSWRAIDAVTDLAVSVQYTTLVPAERGARRIAKALASRARSARS